MIVVKKIINQKVRTHAGVGSNIQEIELSSRSARRMEGFGGWQEIPSSESLVELELAFVILCLRLLLCSAESLRE